MICTRLGLSHRVKGRSYFLWKCSNCTSLFVARSDSNLKTCGCLSSNGTWSHRQEKEGKHTAELKAYRKMKERCCNPTCNDWPNYGGRGIAVCDRWLGVYGFKNFLIDMKKRPSNKHTLDRIDVNGMYCPDNCRWVTRKTQNRNKRSNLRLTWNGVTKVRAEWIEYLEVKRYTWDHLKYRQGLDDQQILELLMKGRGSGG